MNTFSSLDNYNVVLTDRRCPGVTEHIVDNKNDLLFAVWLI